MIHSAAANALRRSLDRYGRAAPARRPRLRLPRIGLRCTIALAVQAHALILVAAYAYFHR